MRIISSILIATLLLAVAPAPSRAAAGTFPDMEHSWFRYREAVEYLHERGIIQGNPDGTFRPRDLLNRAELLKIAMQGSGEIPPAERRCFSDVDPKEWYAPFICEAERRGIVDGYPNGTFQPGQTVNFAEAIKIVLREQGRTVEERIGAAWYEPYVALLDEEEILPRHSYVPWDGLTRERAADLLYRVMRHREDGSTFRKSAGCNRPGSGVPSSVEVNGQERSFLLTTPKKDGGDKPAPLIIAFHGRTNSNERVRSYYRLDRLAEEFFIAYPAGLPTGGGGFSWSDPGDDPKELRDIAFFDALVELLGNRYCIDMDRIFVVGHSLGGWFANSVACARGGVVRASATVGGTSVITDCTGPAAAWIAYNPKDTTSSFAGAEATRSMRVEENACLWDAKPTEPLSFRCVRHASCAGGNDVVWCPHEKNEDEQGDYYPHNWPRDTAVHIVAFFRSLTNK